MFRQKPGPHDETKAHPPAATPPGRFRRWAGRRALPFGPESPGLGSGVAIGLFILIVVGGPALYFCLRMNRALSPPVPTFEGRPVAEWWDQLHDPDPTRRRAAGETLVRYGGPAVLVPSLAAGPWNVRQSAADVLAGLGQSGAEVLVGSLGDRECRRLAIPTLVRMGPVALPALVAGLEKPDAFDRGAAAEALGGLGPEAASAVPKLVKLLDDKAVRSSAAQALGRIGPAAREAVPALTPLLRDPGDDVRTAAFEALGRLGPAADAAVPALIDALADPARRTHAAEALAAIGPAAVPALRTAGGQDEATRTAAEAVLRRIEGTAAPQPSGSRP